ncbi:formate dehydrogenase accessory sulfurtransferase FdhD [Actinocorallia sp. API 0066]|uniref:formate dehydrogenase accessory sulfurtransferase FdhD n=1 Tax=Actinocorallia sp. API 0066 TaxID=2896846 RepID=UPI001E2D13AC|nr:formate dehydrogenase accessory sulfurtransferase FdhD [Actinocorallia sp. API 0066]MCD0449528.1 formate dehydrogenase accessory sulfurtransferase FdhD [Actinocorallia sp. API 0066]
MGRVTERRRVARWTGEATTERVDTLAVEEPLEIQIGGRSLTVTMRTPGADFDLVAGFLLAEGVIAGPADLVAMKQCGDDEFNIVDVALGRPWDGPARAFPTSSACGVCGTASVADLAGRAAWDVAADPVSFSPAALTALPDALRAAQKVFASTGGLHAAGLFTTDGELRCLREDVGRHNAVDKVVGWALKEGLLPLRGHVLMVSGRASFELTQKAWAAGVPVLAAVSAPSSLAVSLAAKAGLTLVGFLRPPTFNVYTRHDRVRQ